VSANTDALRVAVDALQQWIGDVDTAVRAPTEKHVKALQASGVNAGKAIAELAPPVRAVLAGILHDINERAGDIPEEAFQ